MHFLQDPIRYGWEPTVGFWIWKPNDSCDELISDRLPPNPPIEDDGHQWRRWFDHRNIILDRHNQQESGTLFLHSDQLQTARGMYITKVDDIDLLLRWVNSVNVEIGPRGEQQKTTAITQAPPLLLCVWCDDSHCHKKEGHLCRIDVRIYCRGKRC